MSERLKALFTETIIICFFMVVGIGIEGVVFKLTGKNFVLSWYQPLSIAFVAFLCALVTNLTLTEGFDKKKSQYIRIVIHFVLVYGINALAGFILEWFNSVRLFIGFTVIFIFVYSFSWIGTAIVTKSDADKINAALNEIRDEE